MTDQKKVLMPGDPTERFSVDDESELIKEYALAYNSVKENAPFDMASAHFSGRELSFQEVVEHLVYFPLGSYIIVDSIGIDRRPTDFIPALDWEEMKKRVL